ncbi:hypothetical protein DdX_13351 [Ditylenchus destructor]|uniref:Uncharacterized protein n=1 Tax=Ditylenchus destructor TaxID=166010 RepID=A0AAD4QWL8_9BILA|nr:hypothetical protein DdX_13351 [Ditylenchus destructor]
MGVSISRQQPGTQLLFSTLTQRNVAPGTILVLPAKQSDKSGKNKSAFGAKANTLPAQVANQLPGAPLQTISDYSSGCFAYPTNFFGAPRMSQDEQSCSTSASEDSTARSKEDQERIRNIFCYGS